MFPYHSVRAPYFNGHSLRVKRKSGKKILGGSVQVKFEKDISMGISALLIATALSLTMLVAVSDLS